MKHGLLGGCIGKVSLCLWLSMGVCGGVCRLDAGKPARASPHAGRLVVAVPYFENIGSDRSHLGLERELTDRLIASFVGSSPGALFDVVERNRLDAVLAELHIDEKLKLDEQTRHRIGLALGARYLVLGTYTVNAGKIVLRASIVAVETTRLEGTADSAGKLDDLANVVRILDSKLRSQISELPVPEAPTPSPARMLSAPTTQDADAKQRIQRGKPVRTTPAGATRGSHSGAPPPPTPSSPESWIYAPDRDAIPLLQR